MITRPFGPTGVPVAVIGQGTWRMGEDAVGTIRGSSSPVARMSARHSASVRS